MILYDSEIKILEILWKNGPTRAAEIAKILGPQVGWSRNTVYTIIGHLLKKGLIERSSPKFICTPTISFEDARNNMIADIKEKFFDNSSYDFIHCMLSNKDLSDEQIKDLYSIIEKEMRSKNP